MKYTDPTAIPMKYDPEQQRFVGIAVHGNMRFDVPYLSRVTPNLWQGGCMDGLILPVEVKHLVSLYLTERYRVRHQLETDLRIRLDDDRTVPNRAQTVALAQWVNTCRQTGVTLVHCQAGLNRSGLITGLALVLDGMTPREAVKLLRAVRSPAVLCNPVFERWLLDFKVT